MGFMDWFWLEDSGQWDGDIIGLLRKFLTLQFFSF